MLILSFTKNLEHVWAAGPDGLWKFSETWQQQAQPEQELYCCAVTGKTLLVGGAPHVIAHNLDGQDEWQAAWVDRIQEPVLCIAADPRLPESGVLLAGSDGAGILRSTDGGRNWKSCNFGLQDLSILCLTWAPAAPANAWPRWERVWAGSESGIYFSPNGGRAWRLAHGPQAPVQALAVAADFHQSGVVLAGTEGSGLWRSDDHGKTFNQVQDAPGSINALAALAEGWCLSDATGLWFSRDGREWALAAGSPAALALLPEKHGLWTGGDYGVAWADLPW